MVRGEHARHLSRVLRVEPGQVFELSDTRQLYLGRVAAVEASRVEFAIEERLPAPPPLPVVTLLAAVFKFDRMEWMVEKASELGAARIAPVIAARTDKGLALATGKRVERWRRIAFEAAQQSRRLKPLDITDPAPLAQAVKEAPAGDRWMLDESVEGPGQGPLLGPAPAAGSVVLVGPEGGWTEGERRIAREGGFVPIGLGPLILRAETAALAALAVLLYANWEQSSLK